VINNEYCFIGVDRKGIHMYLSILDQ